MAKLVSKTYGDALFELALEEKKMDAFLTEIKVISEALRDNQDLARLMNHPKIVKEEKIVYSSSDANKVISQTPSSSSQGILGVTTTYSLDTEIVLVVGKYS